MAQVETFGDTDHDDDETQALMANLIKQFDRVVQLSPGLPQEMGSMATSIKEPGTLADMVASTINSSPEEKQQVLETRDSTKRLKRVTKLVHHQLEILELGNKIQSQVKETWTNASGVLPAPAAQGHQGGAGRNRRSLGGTGRIPGQNQGAGTSRRSRQRGRTRDRPALAHASLLGGVHGGHDLLDWLTELPWNTSTEDNLDIKKARKVLDEDHFGLEKPKRGSSNIWQ